MTVMMMTMNDEKGRTTQNECDTLERYKQAAHSMATYLHDVDDKRGHGQSD
jgi:hypothetical protein